MQKPCDLIRFSRPRSFYFIFDFPILPEAWANTWSGRLAFPRGSFRVLLGLNSRSRLSDRKPTHPCRQPWYRGSPLTNRTFYCISIRKRLESYVYPPSRRRRVV